MTTFSDTHNLTLSNSSKLQLELAILPPVTKRVQPINNDVNCKIIVTTFLAAIVITTVNTAGISP